MRRLAFDELSLDDALKIACARPEDGEEKEKVYMLIEMTGCESGYEYNRASTFLFNAEELKK